MGRRGPKPAPHALRVLRGTVASTSAPGARGEAPAMPEGLSEAERACWHGIVAELQTVPGLLAAADRGVMELIARLEPMMRTAAVTVRDKGTTLESFDAEGRLKFV